MQVLIPNKDTLFFLAGCQKSALAEFNKVFFQSNLAVPVFPLWCMNFDFCGEIDSVEISGPFVRFNEICFNVAVNSSAEYKIVCGRFGKELRNEEIEKIRFENFKRSERVFRIGDAVFEQSAWKLISQKWHKIRSSSKNSAN